MQVWRVNLFAFNSNHGSSRLPVSDASRWLLPVWVTRDETSVQVSSMFSPFYFCCLQVMSCLLGMKLHTYSNRPPVPFCVLFFLWLKLDLELFFFKCVGKYWRNVCERERRTQRLMYLFMQLVWDAFILWFCLGQEDTEIRRDDSVRSRCLLRVPLCILTLYNMEQCQTCKIGWRPSRLWYNIHHLETVFFLLWTFSSIQFLRSASCQWVKLL